MSGVEGKNSPLSDSRLFEARVIESVLPIPAPPRVARMGGIRPFVTVALGRFQRGMPPRPLVIHLEGEERAVLESVNVEDLTVSVSARRHAIHGGDSMSSRFFRPKRRRRQLPDILGACLICRVTDS